MTVLFCVCSLSLSHTQHRLKSEDVCVGIVFSVYLMFVIAAVLALITSPCFSSYQMSTFIHIISGVHISWERI
jgi:hypothetical protein